MNGCLQLESTLSFGRVVHLDYMQVVQWESKTIKETKQWQLDDALFFLGRVGCCDATNKIDYGTIFGVDPFLLESSQLSGVLLCSALQGRSPKGTRLSLQ